MPTVVIRSVISRPRPSPVERAADKHSAFDKIDDDNNDDESSDDESVVSVGGSCVRAGGAVCDHFDASGAVLEQRQRQRQRRQQFLRKRWHRLDLQKWPLVPERHQRRQRLRMAIVLWHIRRVAVAVGGACVGSDDESSDSGTSFDELGNVPHKASASFPEPLGGFGGAAPNHVLVQLHRRYAGLCDNDTDGTLVDGEHDDHCDPNAVYADPSTPPAKPNRPPPPVEAPDTASPPSRYLLACELQARAGNCASPPDTPHDGGAVRAFCVLRVGESSARSDELAAVRRRIIFHFHATRIEVDTALPMPDPKLFTTVSKDDADTLKTRSWSSLWHDELCGCGGEGGGADGINELGVDGAVAEA